MELSWIDMEFDVELGSFSSFKEEEDDRHYRRNRKNENYLKKIFFFKKNITEKEKWIFPRCMRKFRIPFVTLFDVFRSIRGKILIKNVFCTLMISLGGCWNGDLKEERSDTRDQICIGVRFCN